MIVDFWAGQPTLYDALLYRYSVPARDTLDDIYYRSDLTAAQLEQIDTFEHNPGSRGRVYVYVTAYFESKAGLIKVEKKIERSQI